MWEKMATAALALAAVWVPVLGCSSSADEDCIAGKQCTCADCNKTCGGSGKSCQFSCTGGDCTFSCPGGSCQVTASNAASVTLDCPGVAADARASWSNVRDKGRTD